MSDYPSREYSYLEIQEMESRIEELESALEIANEKNAQLALGQRIRIVGNHGADYLDIKLVEDNVIRLEVGHTCLTSIKHEIPIELLTAILSDLVWRVAGSKRTVTEALIGLCGVLWGMSPSNAAWVKELQGKVRKV